eukprot:3655211-Amphidinium_carterae.1
MFGNWDEGYMRALTLATHMITQKTGEYTWFDLGEDGASSQMTRLAWCRKLLVPQVAVRPVQMDERARVVVFDIM